MLFVMFAHDERRWAQTENLEHAVQLCLTVRRIDETQVGCGDLPAAPPRPGDHARAHEPAPVAAAQALRCGGDEPERGWVAVDKRRRCRAT